MLSYPTLKNIISRLKKSILLKLTSPFFLVLQTFVSSVPKLPKSIDNYSPSASFSPITNLYFTPTQTYFSHFPLLSKIFLLIHKWNVHNIRPNSTNFSFPISVRFHLCARVTPFSWLHFSYSSVYSFIHFLIYYLSEGGVPITKSLHNFGKITFPSL